MSYIAMLIQILEHTGHSLQLCFLIQSLAMKFYQRTFSISSMIIFIIRRRSFFNPNIQGLNDADAVEDIPDGESVWEHDSASPPKSLFVIPNTPRLMVNI